MEDDDNEVPYVSAAEMVYEAHKLYPDLVLDGCQKSALAEADLLEPFTVYGKTEQSGEPDWTGVKYPTRLKVAALALFSTLKGASVVTQYLRQQWLGCGDECFTANIGIALVIGQMSVIGSALEEFDHRYHNRTPHTLVPCANPPSTEDLMDFAHDTLSALQSLLDELRATLPPPPVRETPDDQ